MPQKRTRRTRTSASPAKRPRRASARSGGAARQARRTRGRVPSRPRGTNALHAKRIRGEAAGRAAKPSAPSPSNPTLRGSVAEGYEVKLPGGQQVLLTRRHFLYGAAGVAAAALVGAGGYALDQATSKNDKSVTTLSVPTDAVFTTEDCELLEDAGAAMQLVTQKELAYGTLIWANDDTWAACLIPTEQAKPLAQIGMLSLTSGSLNVLVKNAVGEDEGFEIYDVRACATGIVWTEADIMDGSWRVYSATTDGGSIGTPALVEEGDSNWEMPTLAAAAGHAWWQLLPRLDGERSKEDSKLKRAPFGSSEAETICVSEGRMCTPVCATTEGVVVTPRAQTSGTYYQLTYIGGNGNVLDTLVLPSSMRPLEASYGENGFSFAFDAIYNYGGGIANLGTYTPASPVDAAGEDPTGVAGATAYGKGAWFRFPRTPVCAPAWCGKWFMVKSTTAVCGVDFENRRYFALETKSGCDDYGDYLASTGTQNRVVTYTNIDHTTLEGETQKCCLVRVWTAV